MVRLNTTVWLALVLGATAALADSRQDCRQVADRDLAIRGCTEVIRDNPRATWAYYNRGNAYRANGDNDGAIADLSKAIALDPKDADFYINRGIAYQAKGETDRAIADFGKAIELNPNDARALYNRGNANRARRSQIMRCPRIANPGQSLAKGRR